MTARSEPASATVSTLPLAALAGLVALATSVARHATSVVLQFAPDAVTAQTASLYLLGGRLVVFALTYGLLFGVAHRAGRHSGDPDGDVRTAAAVGVAAALVYVVASAALFLSLDVQQGPLTVAAWTVGSGVATGVQLAVVAFAGIALARR